jgi:hypothetical protein
MAQTEGATLSDCYLRTGCATSSMPGHYGRGRSRKTG